MQKPPTPLRVMSRQSWRLMRAKAITPWNHGEHIMKSLLNDNVITNLPRSQRSAAYLHEQSGIFFIDKAAKHVNSFWVNSSVGLRKGQKGKLQKSGQINLQMVYYPFARSGKFIRWSLRLNDCKRQA
jgi:hypothetical protein